MSTGRTLTYCQGACGTALAGSISMDNTATYSWKATP